MACRCMHTTPSLCRNLIYAEGAETSFKNEQSMETAINNQFQYVSFENFPTLYTSSSIMRQKYMNILVDDELNITCIIDRAFCSTVPYFQLFSTPGLPRPRDLLADHALVGTFQSAFEEECSRSRSLREQNRIRKSAIRHHI